MIRNIIFALNVFFIFAILSCGKNFNAEEEVESYLDIISINKDNINSIAGISLNSTWQHLSSLLDVDIDVIRDNVLYKNLLINGYNAKLSVFVDSDSIYQVSLVLEQAENEEDISIFFDEINKEIDKNISIEPFVNIIEEDDGSILEKTTTYIFANQTFFISIGGDYLSINIADSNNIL